MSVNPMTLMNDWVARGSDSYRLLLLCFFWLLNVGCAPSCSNKIVAEVLSPDAGTMAVVFARDCGATTGFSTHVSVVAAHDHEPEGVGNVFVSDDNHGAAGLRTDNTLDVSVRWLSNTRMLIRYPARARVFVKNTQVRGVVIDYEPAD